MAQEIFEISRAMFSLVADVQEGEAVARIVIPKAPCVWIDANGNRLECTGAGLVRFAAFTHCTAKFGCVSYSNNQEPTFRVCLATLPGFFTCPS